ncbi:MAG: hypothetical protein COV52_07005 [Gammaproteobacteria bacterium CG11_big_fil_rev_8_21_14_0_20_46_22]|nr:MAG: hypothetical protein COW05_06120 [Gammaproteobacteria bacterium CG12_big_fil_rev_8_21_14_0_65_46_12]PIR10788.1 MAG: hypothetical protein COV52_07005 [Gammaproteobacteria bacterium CG11_big_fil_rev_8_21_14_0_20_46_22]
MQKALLLLMIVLCGVLTACSDDTPGLSNSPPRTDPYGVGDATAGAVSGYGEQVADALTH